MLRSCPTLSSFLFAALTSPLFTQSLHAADAFTTRFEHDTEGTWLAYPTRPGWHYKVERSASTADEGFAYVPGTFSYGDGQQARLWIAPPPPPPGPVTAPPPRTWHSVHLRVHVATEPGVEKIEVIRLGPPDQPPLWGTVLSKKLHPRPWPQFLLINGDTPEVRWRISGTVFSRPSIAVPGDPDSGFTYTESSPLPPGAAEDVALLEAHWARIVGQLTPSSEDSVYLPTEEEPEPDTSGTPPPIPAEPQRVFYRVKETAVDTNGNGLYDWWELQHSYKPFVLAGTNGYADPYTDVDGDGLDGLAEQNAGTNPRLWDTDGDLSPDGEELEELTSPLDPQSTPLVLAGLSRRMLSVLWYQQNGWLWGINGYADWDSGTVPGLPASWVPGRKIYSDPIADGQWNTGFPRLEEWAGLLSASAVFPPVMPPGTRKLRTYTDSILPDYAVSPLNSVSWLHGAGMFKPWDDEATALDHQRVWLRGPVAQVGGTSRAFILRKEMVRGHYDLTSPLQTTIIDEYEITGDAAALTIPEGYRVSNDHIDLTPSFKAEVGRSLTDRYFQVQRWSLIGVDLDIVHPATGELDEDKEDSTSIYVEEGRGGLVAIKRDENTPKTKLVLRASRGLPPEAKFRVNADSRIWTGKLKIWKDAAATEPVVSGETEFPADVETTLYIVGEDRTVTDDFVIKQQVKLGNSWLDGDKVSTTIVHAEIPIVLRAFIPHRWTRAEHFPPLPPPLSIGYVVGGDRTDYSLLPYKEQADTAYGFTSRLEQTTVLTPFKELHSELDIESARKERAAAESHYYQKSTKVPASDQNLDFGDTLVPSATADYSYEASVTEKEYKNGKRYTDGGRPISELTLKLSGEPGMPFGAAWGIAPNIDWTCVIKIDTRYPTALKAKVEVEHNLYPAYEVIIGNSDGSYVPLWQIKPTAGTFPGAGSLNQNLTGAGDEKTVN